MRCNPPKFKHFETRASFRTVRGGTGCGWTLTLRARPTRNADVCTRMGAASAHEAGSSTEAGIGIERFMPVFGANMAQVLRLHEHSLISHSPLSRIVPLLKNLLKVLTDILTELFTANISHKIR